METPVALVGILWLALIALAVFLVLSPIFIYFELRRQNESSENILAELRLLNKNVSGE